MAQISEISGRMRKQYANLAKMDKNGPFFRGNGFKLVKDFDSISMTNGLKLTKNDSKLMKIFEKWLKIVENQGKMAQNHSKSMENGSK